MIVDVHAHAFPPLAGPCGYSSKAEHMAFLQTHLAVRGPVVARKGPAFEAGDDVDFQVGQYGRLNWTKDGETGSTQWMPPSLQDMAAPPELMIAQMDSVGVDKAVLYQGHVYGCLNDYLSDCTRRYPDRLVAVAQILEAYGDQLVQLDEVRRSSQNLGLKGLYYEIEHFRIVGSSVAVDDSRFDPLWEEITSLGMVLVWDIGRHLDPADHLKHLGRVQQIIKRFPRMICILTHFGSYIRDPETKRIFNWDEILAVAALDNVFLEILQVQYPSTCTGDEYPFPIGQKTIEDAFRRLGSEKLIWGADMPALERACTYRQSLDYVRVHCAFMTAREKDRVLGGNAAELFGLD